MKSFSGQIKDQSIECRSKQPSIDRQSQAGWGQLIIKWQMKKDPGSQNRIKGN